MDIRDHLNEEAHYIDGVLADCLAPLQGSVMHAAMLCSAVAGQASAARFVLAVYEACTRDRERIKPVLAAIEMVHAYSIISG